MKNSKIEHAAPIGRWGRLHLDYIKENQVQFFNKLLELNMLNNYLENLDKQAQVKFEELIEELSRKPEIPVCMKENLNFLVEEIILDEMIYHVS